MKVRWKSGTRYLFGGFSYLAWDIIVRIQMKRNGSDKIEFGSEISLVVALQVSLEELASRKVALTKHFH